MTERSSGRADSAVAAVATDPLRARFHRARVFSWMQAVGIVALLAVTLGTPGFLAGPSILSLLTTVSFIGCVAIGMTLITMRQHHVLCTRRHSWGHRDGVHPGFQLAG